MIKEIQQKDLETFFELIAEVEAGSHFNFNNSDHIAWLKRKIDAYFNSGVEFLGSFLESDTPIGFASFRINEKLHCPPNCEILDLGVYTKFRRRGYATELLKHIEQIATEAGVHCIHLRTYADDSQATSFYMKNEYIPIAILPEVNGPNDTGDLYLQKVLTYTIIKS